MTDTTTVDAIERITQQAADGDQLDPGAIYAYRLGDRVHLVDLTGDQYMTQPTRKTGVVKVRDVTSFATFWEKHSIGDRSEIYADRDARTITAVLDAHGADAEDTGWAQHRLILGLNFSEQMKTWLAADNRLMSQEAFAEFLDDNRADIYSPPAAEMLEIAQTIEGTSKVDWQASHRLVDGQRRLAYVETNTARAGQKGELAIPTVLLIHLPVFDGATEAHQLEARFRHRIDGGALKLGVKLVRPNDLITAAFNGVVDQVAEACGAVVMRGAPA